MTRRRKQLLPGSRGQSVPAAARPRWLPALLLALPLCLLLSLPLPVLGANEMTGALQAFRSGDYAKALRLTRPLAARENSQAMYLLGVMYEQGKGVERDDATAVKWYAAAARKASNASAQYNLARMYLDGRGVRKNEAKAREWLQVAAAQGHAESIKLLAELGAPVAAAAPPAPPAAAPVAGAASAAAPANAPVAKAEPPARAPESPVKAASAPPPPAPAAPAAAGTPPVIATYQGGDYARALKLAQALAAKEDGPGMYVLGKLYEEGSGIKRDDYTAVKWLAAASHKANYAPAEYALARMYVDGRGVGKNLAKAREWLSAAAAQGHAESQRLLAELGGKSVPVAAAAPTAPVASAAPAVPAPAVAAVAPAAPVAPTPPRPAEVAKAPEPAAKPAPAPKAAEPEAPKTAMLARPAPPAEAPVAPPPATVPAPPIPATAAPRAGPPFGAYSASAAKAAIANLDAAFKRSANAGPAAARVQLEEPLLAVTMRYWEAEAGGQRQGMDELRAAVQANAPAAIGVGRGLRASSGGSELATAALLSELTQGGSGAATQACDAYVAAANARGPDHPPALFHAALCNAQKNPKQSLDWLHAAALAGHAGALETLGRACMEGAEKDWGCASHYFELAARAGRASSMTLYGWVLSNQPAATDRDFTSAIEWYRKGAAAGDLFAQNNIGEMYERGRGTHKDDKLARQWYGRAAEAGFGPGQFNYARMLLAGSGGPTDRDGAVQWLKKADSNGVAPAKAALQQIAAAGNIK